MIDIAIDVFNGLDVAVRIRAADEGSLILGYLNPGKADPTFSLHPKEEVLAHYAADRTLCDALNFYALTPGRHVLVLMVDIERGRWRAGALTLSGANRRGAA